MRALAALALVALAFGAAHAADAPREVRWIVGPASVELVDGRVRCEVPGGIALAGGTSARSILEVVAHRADGGELAVLSPVAPARTWFIVVGWRELVRPPVAGGEPEGSLVWLERPRLDERSGRWRWALAGRGVGGPSVNRHVLLPAGGGGVEVTLVAPVEELSEAGAQLERIVDGLSVTAKPAPRRR